MRVNNILKFIVTMSLITTLSAQEQVYIAVLELEGKGLTELEASILSDRLRHELFQTGYYKVVEREMMGEILKEQGFQLTECTSAECMVEMGRVLGVEQMIGGSVSKFGNLFSIFVRIISVETGELLGTATFDHEGRIEDLLRYGLQQVVVHLTTFGDREQEPGEEVVQDSPAQQEREIVAQVPPESGRSEPVEKKRTSPTITKTKQLVPEKQSYPDYNIKSEVGIYGLENKDVIENFKGTIGPLVGVNITRTLLETPLGNFGPLAGYQVAKLILTERSWDEISYIHDYHMLRLGIYGTPKHASKFSLAMSIGYVSLTHTSQVQISGMDSRDVDKYSKQHSGAYCDFFINYALSKSYNLLAELDLGIVIAGKENSVGGRKFALGLSLGF